MVTGWAFGKVADLLWDGAKGTLQERLTKTDLERAMSAGLQAATEWNQDQPKGYFSCTFSAANCLQPNRAAVR